MFVCLQRPILDKSDCTDDDKLNLSKQLKEFEQQIELIKSSFRILSQEITTLRGSVDVRFESVDARFEQQLELIKSGFKTLSQEIATLKKN